MTTWRYIVGNEKHFKDASSNMLFAWRSVYGSSHFTTYDIYSNNCEYTLVAQRDRVTSVNDERLARDMGVDALISERGNRYGKFADGATIMQHLKNVMHQTEGWSRLTDSQREALDMIQHKIGRALNGDPTYDDNWKDIAGYATLVAEELNGVKK